MSSFRLRSSQINPVLISSYTPTYWEQDISGGINNTNTGNVGIKISVSNVLRVSPPITVMANEAPMVDTNSAFPIARGNIAITVVDAVIRIGLILAIPAAIKALERL